MADVINPPSPLLQTRILWSLTGANLNSTGDQAFGAVVPFTRYRVTEIFVTNVSATLTAYTGTLAVRTATGGAGVAIVGTQLLSALLTSANMITCAILNSDIRTETPLYARLSSALGSAATCDIYIVGIALG